MKEFNSGTRWHGQLFSKNFPPPPGRERVKGYVLRSSRRIPCKPSATVQGILFQGRARPESAAQEEEDTR